MKKNYILKAKLHHIELTPSLYLKYANDCFVAAQIFKNTKYFSVVPYYLYSKSIEVSLKAFLLHNGVKLGDLKDHKKLGHDIEKILIKSEEYKLDQFINLSDLELTELKKASLLYNTKKISFGYPSLEDAVCKYSKFPELKILEILSLKFLKIKDLL